MNARTPRREGGGACYAELVWFLRELCECLCMVADTIGQAISRQGKDPETQYEALKWPWMLRTAAGIAGRDQGRKGEGRRYRWTAGARPFGPAQQQPDFNKASRPASGDHFDQTLGFPGEGPVACSEDRQGHPTIVVGTANVTAWNSYIDADIPKAVLAQVWCIQEHKLVEAKQIAKARGWMSARGLNSSFERANKTLKGGTSAGVAVAWSEGFRTRDAAARKQGHEVNAACSGRLRIQAMDIAETTLVVGSIYGNCDDEGMTRAILAEAVRVMEGQEGLAIIGADWNITPTTARQWIQGINPSWEVVAPPGDTCFTAAGSSKIDFFIMNRAAAGLLVGVQAHQTALRTHRVVTVEIQVHGEVWVERWIKPKAIPTNPVCGPWRPAGETAHGARKIVALRKEIGKLKDDGRYMMEEDLQDRVDSVMEQWCELAATELEGRTGARPAKMGQVYEYRWEELVAQSRRGGPTGSAQSDECKENVASAWFYMRMCEAVSYLEGMGGASRTQGWSGKIGHEAARRQGEHPGLKAGELVQILYCPWNFTLEQVREAWKRWDEEHHGKKAKRREASIKKWRQKMAEHAKAGRKQAYQWLKQVDNPDDGSGVQKGVAQVLDENVQIWAKLWQCEDGARCREARDFVAGRDLDPHITVEGLRMSAKSFSPTTACTDGLPPKAVGLLSDDLLGLLATMANVWVGRAVWPTCEGQVHIVLLPKPTGGERPIGLFRSIVRVVCKAVAWDGLQWFGEQDIPQLNTSKGRRVGDAIWRAQMRAYIDPHKQAGEIMIDLMKAFEYVSRRRLAERGARGDYPMHVLAASLATYGFPRRLVYKGYATQVLHPRRGITAGSPFATGDLWLVCSDVMHRIFKEYPQATFVIHVDDFSYSMEGNDAMEVSKALASLHERVKAGISAEAGMVIAEAKTVAIGSSMEVAQELGVAIRRAGEGSIMCKKLGVDYRIGIGSQARGKVVGRKGKRQRPGQKVGRLPTQGLVKVRGKGRLKQEGLAVRQARILKAARRAARLKFFDEGRGRLFVGAVLPAAIYGAEHEPWAEEDVLVLEKQAVMALGLRAPGVPHKLAAAGIPVTADPRFKVHFAALERWAREVWLRAYGDGSKFLAAKKRIPGDVLTAKEIATLWWQMTQEPPDTVQAAGGPRAALQRAVRHFDLEWTGPVVWHDQVVGEIVLSEGSPAMLKHILSNCRKRRLVSAFSKLVCERQEHLASTAGLGSSLAGALGTEVDWQYAADIYTDPGVGAKAKRMLGALAWGVVPTPVWLAQHGWECECRCEACGREQDLTHLIRGCEAAPEQGTSEHKDDPWRTFFAYAVDYPDMKFCHEEVARAGHIREWRNGVEVERGSICLTPAQPIYSDGSAKLVGTRWAAGAAAIVQYEQGIEKAWAMSLPEGFPVSAVAAEHMAMLLCMVVAEESQSKAAQSRGVEPQVVQQEWEGKVQVYADCMAVIHATRNPERALRDQFKYAGCYKHPAYRCLSKVHKVAAHKGEDQARREGWWQHWKGNNAADEVAKLARPRIIASEKVQIQAVKDMRQRKKALAGISEMIAPLWKAFAGVKKGYVGRAQASHNKASQAPHAPSFVQGSWLCRICGQRIAGTYVQGVFVGRRGCAGVNKVWANTHGTHSTHVGFGASSGQSVVFCTKCGAYGGSKAVKLKEACVPNDRGKRITQWKALMIKQSHPGTREPLVRIRKAAEPSQAVRGVKRRHDGIKAERTESAEKAASSSCPSAPVMEVDGMARGVQVATSSGGLQLSWHEREWLYDEAGTDGGEAWDDEPGPFFDGSEGVT